MRTKVVVNYIMIGVMVVSLAAGTIVPDEAPQSVWWPDRSRQSEVVITISGANVGTPSGLMFVTSG